MALEAVFAAAQELKVSVIVGLSEAEREFVGTGQIAALVRSLREEFEFPIFLRLQTRQRLNQIVKIGIPGAMVEGQGDEHDKKTPARTVHARSTNP